SLGGGPVAPVLVRLVRRNLCRPSGVVVWSSIGSDGVWVVALYGKVLARIDPSSRQVVTRIATPGQASGVLATADSVWLANYDLGTISRVNRTTNRISRTYRVGRQPRGIAEAGGAIWVANQASNSVSRIAAPQTRAAR